MFSVFLITLMALPCLMVIEGASVQRDVLKQLNKHSTKRSDGLLGEVVNLPVKDKREREIVLDKFRTMKQIIKEMKTCLDSTVTDVSSRQFQNMQNQLDTMKQSLAAHIKDSSTRYNDILTELKAIKSPDRCNKHLIMESAVDADSLISTSGAHPHCKTKELYKINSKEGNRDNGEAGAWCASNINDKLSSYVQVKFKKDHRLLRVATQGRKQASQYVTKYQVHYSTDCINFSTDGKTYPGNTDPTSVVINTLDKPMTGQCFRIYPRGYVNYMSMRFDFIGCSI